MKVISKDHNLLFSEAQEKYLKDRSENNLSNIYLILVDYYKNLFINYTHKKNLYWNDEIILEKAHDASCRIIERFIKKPSFKIEKLTSYGHWDFIKVLYQDKEEEMNTESLEEFSIGISKEEENITAVKYYEEYYY